MLNRSFLVGPGGYLKKFQKGRRHLGVRALAFLYSTIFHTVVPLRLPSIDKWYSFHTRSPEIDLYIPLNCC